MIKRTVSSFVLLIFLYLLQTTVMNRLAIGGIKPDLLIILVVIVAYRYGRIPGMFMGFFAGLLLDLAEADYVGYYAMFYTIAGYFSGFSNQLYFNEYSVIPVFVTAAADMGLNFIEYTAGFLLRNRLDFPYYFTRIIIPGMLYTVFVSVFLYRFLNFVYRKVDSIKFALPKRKKEEKEDDIV